MNIKSSIHVAMVGLLSLTCAAGAQMPMTADLVDRDAEAYEVNPYANRRLDLQYFSRPFERSGVMGGAYMGAAGSAASVVQNPGALGFVKGDDLLTYWTYNYLKGQSLGRKSIHEPEWPISRFSDLGLLGAFQLGQLPGVIGLGVDGLNNDVSGDDVTELVNRGQRLTMAYALPITPDLSIGYSLTYLRDQSQIGISWVMNSLYHIRTEADSWLNRLGLQGKIGDSCRWGLQAEYGFGSADTTWNGQLTGGDNDNTEHGARAGFEWDMSPRLTLASDFEWRWMSLQFGRHSSAIGQSMDAEWRGDIYRPSLGLRQKITDDFSLMYGYRHNFFQVIDLCDMRANTQYATVALGADWRFAKRYGLLANLEYSWIDPEGEIMSTLALRADL